MECEILGIKKTSMKTIQIGLQSVFLNVPIKHVQEIEKEKKFNCRRKITFFYVNFSSIAALEKQRYGFSMPTLFLEFLVKPPNSGHHL